MDLASILSSAEFGEIDFDPNIISAIIAASVAVLLAQFYQRYLLLESIWKSDTSLNINVNTKFIQLPKRRDFIILETRVEVHNNSRQPCCILAAYVNSRALISPSRPMYKNTTQFDELERCGELSDVTNVAWIPRSIIQVTPDETESFVRWDTISKNYMKDYPVIVVNVEIFATRHKHVGMSLRKSRIGKLRNKWIDFVGEDRSKKNSYIVFSRWNSGGQSYEPFKPNARYLIDSEGKPDLKNSKVFRSMLNNMVQWSRHITVDFRLSSDN